MDPSKTNSITYFLHDVVRQPQELQRALDYLQSVGPSPLGRGGDVSAECPPYLPDRYW